MPRRSLVPARVERSVAERICREAPVARRLRAETARLPQAGMQIGPDQAAWLGWLVRRIGARRAIETGTFTGMSALAVAGALPPGGRLVACDASEAWTRIARRYWAADGLGERIELRLGPAAESVAALLRDGAAGSFDFAFIDADKTG